MCLMYVSSCVRIVYIREPSMKDLVLFKNHYRKKIIVNLLFLNGKKKKIKVVTNFSNKAHCLCSNNLTLKAK